MKTIIAEKPSVAGEIARIVGATKRENGYIEGNGYYVTWAFGHLVQLAMPEEYGVKGFERANLPVIPPKFTLVPRQKKTDKGYKPDSSVVTQIKIISQLFNKSDQIIVATDAGREGELIFRYLYYYTGCTVPFVRLWISSLTDKAIRDGLANLENGNKYDNLYLAAKARSESDWLVGINGTQALSIAAGYGVYSVGRVQTPALAMVCQRFIENRDFKSIPFWQIHLMTDGMNGETLKLTSSEKWNDKTAASELFNQVKSKGTAIVTKIERKEREEDTPLLFDLTTLQKDANSKHGLTAEQTLEIAQRLYEKKLITYPRTGSRYIPVDVFEEIPNLLSFIGSLPEWANKVQPMPTLTRRSVDGSKVTDHHALLVTGEKPTSLSPDENTVYMMIAGRMIEAFSQKCIKDTVSVSVDSAGVEFSLKGSAIKVPGWRAVYGEGANEEINILNWNEGDNLPVKDVSLAEGKTKPKPLHTEATLLAAMETAGKEIEDETLREAIKDCGIGTPATRASIIETLFKRGYMVRNKKSLVPTDKGLALYGVVKTMRIANVTMTGEWERELARIERGELSVDIFRGNIETFTRDITTEMLGCDKLKSVKEPMCKCPRCGTGGIQIYNKVASCDNKECDFHVFRQIASHNLTETELKDLFTKGKTRLIKGFISKQGNKFEAMVVLDNDGKTSFVFPEKKSSPNAGGRTFGKKR